MHGAEAEPVVGFRPHVQYGVALGGPSVSRAAACQPRVEARVAYAGHAHHQLHRELGLWIGLAGKLASALYHSLVDRLRVEPRFPAAFRDGPARRERPPRSRAICLHDLLFSRSRWTAARSALSNRRYCLCFLLLIFFLSPGRAFGPPGRKECPRFSRTCPAKFDSEIKVFG